MDASTAPIFNEHNFFRGLPPQEAVTEYLVSNRSSYRNFAIYDPPNECFEYYQWDDPVAEKIWKPFLEKGLHVSYDCLDTLHDDDRPLDDEEYLKYVEREELFDYLAKTNDHSYFDFSSDNFDDPLDGLMTIINNPFSPETFSSKLDESIWHFIAVTGKPTTNREYADYAVDVAATNLQMLTNPSATEVKTMRSDSLNLSQTINQSLPKKETFKFSVQFARYLSMIDGRAFTEMYKFSSISAALNLVESNNIIDYSGNDISGFLDANYMSVRGPTMMLIQRIMTKYGFQDTNDLSALMHLMETEDLSYEAVFGMTPVRPPDSPDYIPTSPSNPNPESISDLELSVDPGPSFPPNPEAASSSTIRPPDDEFRMTKEEFFSSLLPIVSFMFFLYGDKFSPSLPIQRVFVRKRGQDFFKQFRKKYSVVYFSRSYKDAIMRDLSAFLAVYLKLRRSDLQLVRIFDRAEEFSEQPEEVVHVDLEFRPCMVKI